MRQRILLFSLLICISISVSSQTVVTIGTASSTTNLSGPANSTTAGDRNERHTCIYSAAELTAAGMLSGNTLFSIAWEKTGAASYAGNDLTIRIWLKHNASTTFPANPTFSTETTGATLVFQTTNGTLPEATGWLPFVFNMSAFTWNGTNNLQVITELIRPISWTATGFGWRTITSLTNAAANASGTIAAPPATLTRTATRPQVRFEVAANGNDAALTSMPSPVSGPPGVQNINVVLRNTGTTTLTTADIGWTINGGASTNFPWSGSLMPGASTTVTLASPAFSLGSNTIQATVSNPNGAADQDPSNNIVSKTIQTCNPLSGAYTINKTLATGGSNFNSFNDFAFYLTNCGVSGHVTATVTAGTGPYAEQVIFQNIPGLGVGATITIQGNGETITSPAVILSTGSNPNRHIIRLIGLQYFTINNLDIDMFPGSTAFIGIHVLNSGNNITISNCNVDMGTATSTLLGAFVANGEPASILTPGGTFDNILITGNAVSGGGYGASVVGLAPPLATNVVISNNTFNNFNSNGVYLRETNGAHVRDNQFDKNTTATGIANAIQYAQSANVNGRVYNNKIRMTQTNGSYVGIYMFAGTGHRVYNNLIYDIRSTTGDIDAIRVRTTGSMPEIYFNTISLDNSTPSTGALVGINEESTNTGVILRNNIISLSQSTSGLKHALELSVLTPATGINSNYNVFWVPGGNIAYRASSASFPTPLIYPTLASWQVASGQDGQSLEADPLFQSVTNPIPTSGVINGQGITIAGITTDILNVIRSNPPDPGAYEFAPPAGDASMTNFILPTIPYCAATLPVQFELTNAGADPLNTVTINWTVNGVPQPVVNWAGPSLASGASTIVTLGTVPISAATLYTFSATTSLPNGNPDVNSSNDNFIYVGFRNGFDGILTINGSAPASATNYQSFQSLADDLNRYGVCNAVTINVMNGSYTEQVVFNTIPGTSATKRVTLNGNNQVLQFNPTVAADDHILQLNAVNFMVVENLTVNSLHPTQGRGIHITNGSSKIAIRNNNVNVSLTNSTSISFGIIISGDNWLLDGSLSDSVVISGNTVSGGYSSIQLSGEHWTQPLTRITVTNNTVLDWYGFGIYLSYTDNAMISGNTIRRPTRTNSGSDAVTPAGITIPAGSLGFVLEKNRMYDFHVSMPGAPEISRGVYVSGTSIAPTSGTIRNNLIYGMNNSGAQYGIQQNSVNGPINIFHNTIVLDNATAAGTSNTSAIRMSNFNQQIQTDIRNNIFVLTRGGTGTKRIIDIDESTTVIALTSNHNIAWLNAPGGSQAYGQVESTTYNTLADWQTGTGKDLNSVFMDPAFVNPPAGNFAPGNPLCDGSYMNTPSVGVTDDILGNPRPVNPDAGAFEVNLPACTGASGGTISTSASSFCSSGTATLSATGFSTGAGTSYQWQSSNDNFVSNVNDMAGQTNPFTATTGSISATTYYRLRVTCSAGPVIGYSNIITIQVSQPVIITSHPQSQTVCTGTSVTFAVVASNAVSYQWQKGLVAIAGATSASFTINNVTTGDAGSYTVIVNGGTPCPSVTSNAATLTVQESVSITGQPASQTVCAGTNVTFTVMATGAGTLTYQWRKATVNISGATSSGYTINNVTTGDAGVYDVIVTGTCGPVTSASATLTVNATGSWIGVTNTDWNTASNWCGGVPTSTTDVIIPSSAPNMPNLSSASGSARNITINIGGTLTVGTGGVLNIYGNVASSGTFNSTLGSLAFRGASGQTISGAAVIAFIAANVTMDGAGGLELYGNAVVNNTLTLINGNITLGIFSISLSSSSTGSVASHIITNSTGSVIVANLAASSSRTVPVGANASSYNPVILAANAGHTTDNFTVNVKQGVFINGVAGATYTDNVVDRTWNINEVIAGGSNVNLTFQWTGAQELPLFQRNRSYVIRHNGSSWIAGPASAAAGTDPYTQTLTGVTAFSPFAVRSDVIPRPVTGIYPNPASNVLNVVLDLPADTPLYFSIYDSKGSLVRQSQVTVLSGVSRTTLNIDNLSSGVYVLKVSSAANTELLVERFVKKPQ